MKTSLGNHTEALSTRKPDAIDIILTEKLASTLIEYGVYESNEDMAHRMSVLSRVNTIFKEWIKEISIMKNIPPENANLVGGKIHTFGSFRLGVHTKGADIDTLCIAPRHVGREDFFDSFYKVLQKQPCVKKLRAIQEAYVPVIRLEFDGIELDMVFARLALSAVPEHLELKDNSLIKNLDERCVRSLNGSRVTDEILDLVPDIASYKLALRAIKLWAKVNGIYSNVLGYLGGVTWGLLLARLCQLYPTAIAAKLVDRFFFVFSTWNWPTPVTIKPIEDAHLGFPIWNPQAHAADRFHLLPVITPAYPQQNSTHNVTKSSRTIILQEMKRALSITEKIYRNECEWSALFTPLNFFSRYKHFLLVIVSAEEKEKRLEWEGLVESKIRLFIAYLDHNANVNIAHVHSRSLKPIESLYSKYPNAVIWPVGVEFVAKDKAVFNLTFEVHSFIGSVMSAASYRNLSNIGVKVETVYVKKKQLNQYFPEDVLKLNKTKSTTANEVSNAKNEEMTTSSSSKLNGGSINKAAGTAAVDGATATSSFKKKEETKTNSDVEMINSTTNIKGAKKVFDDERSSSSTDEECKEVMCSVTSIISQKSDAEKTVRSQAASATVDHPLSCKRSASDSKPCGDILLDTLNCKRSCFNEIETNTKLSCMKSSFPA